MIPQTLTACGDPSHVYEGRLFVEARGCLGTKSSLDVVTGDAPGECPPVCLVQPASTGNDRGVYVSTMCAPYPHHFDVTGTDPSCPAALEALHRNDTCLVDGGSTSPLPPPPDAGP